MFFAAQFSMFKVSCLILSVQFASLLMSPVSQYFILKQQSVLVSKRYSEWQNPFYKIRCTIELTVHNFYITPAIVPYSSVSYWPVNKQVTPKRCTTNYNTLNWMINKLLLPHYLYSGAEHILLFSQRPFHFHCSIGHFLFHYKHNTFTFTFTLTLYILLC